MTHRKLTAPTLEPGPDGSPMLRLRAPDGARAEVHLHGAHLTSWIPAGESEDRLFLSARSKFGAGASIRGGIPVIFPQFAAEGPLPRHGFARTSAWELVGVEREPAGAVATFRLVDSPATRAIWPHPFLAELTVAVGGARLRVALAVANTGDEPIAFTAALHSYFRVRDVERGEVHGLRGVRYRDAAAGGREDVDRAPALVVSGEVNRVYFDAPPALELREPDRVLRLHAAGFSDVVVWNPGAEGAAGLADLAPEEQRHFLCVEAAAVGTPVRLGAGERWVGGQEAVAGR